MNLENNTKFGVREVCNVHFEKLSGIGPEEFEIDTAKMTTMEGASTTVYAQGGWGNSRLVAWDGEKTLTFTIEDALITMEAFQALTGATPDVNNKYTIKPTSFAGTYSITAKTLFRDETGADHLATIVIPKAKLQSNLSLSMAPSGDPSTFTYTFDALAGRLRTEGEDVAPYLFTIQIQDGDYAEGDERGDSVTKTKVTIGNETKEIDAPKPALNITATGAISLIDETPSTAVAAVPFTTKISSGQDLTNGTFIISYGETTALSLKKGSRSTWYIV